MKNEFSFFFLHFMRVSNVPHIGRYRTRTLMKEMGLETKQRRRFRKQTTNGKHDYPVALNKLNRNFKVKKANQVWGVDMTYIPTKEGWLYLAMEKKWKNLLCVIREL